MNVYFIDPTYVKFEAWKPLFSYLKIHIVYSFLSKEDLGNNLYDTIKPYLWAIYEKQDLNKFADNCAFWLRAYFEEKIHLYNGETEVVPKDEIMHYSTNSALNNLKYQNEENCCILLKLKSSFNYEGDILPPENVIDSLRESNLPTHIAKYCLNILHKKYQHNRYALQSSFTIFDEYLSRVYKYIPKRQEWTEYLLTATTGKKVNFIRTIKKQVCNDAPEDFPLIIKEGRKKLSPLITLEGTKDYEIFIENAKSAYEAYLESEYAYLSAEEWNREVEDMNRTFWEECGESGSNLDCWPGWD